MKNTLILIAFISLLFTSCTEEEYEAPNSFSDVGFYTGAGQNSIIQLNIFDYMSFLDLSQGYTEHSWTIEEGNNFLKGPIKSTEKSFEKYVVNAGDTVTKEKSAHVLFNKSGLQKVRLRNVFKDSVAFRGFSQERGDYIMASVKEGNSWVIDTTFVVKVFDTIIPQIEVKQFGALVDYTSKDTIYVEAGDKVQFIDKTTIGEPTGRFWSIRAKGGTQEVVASSSAEVADIVFKKLGHFTARITANRTGQNVPGDSDTYDLVSPFKVIPSSQPFVISGTIIEKEDETIQVPFNGEFSPFLNKESFFKVSVNDVDFKVASVTINPDDSTILDLVLEEKIYRPDVIKVSLLDGSGLESTDTRTPVAFVDEVVKMHDVNLIPSDIATLDTGMGWSVWNASNGTPERSNEKSASGDYSLKMTITPGMAWSEAQAILPNAIALDGTKTYTLKYDMYIDESTTVRPNVGGMFLITNWGWQFWMDYKNETLHPTGKWVTKEIDYKSSAAFTKLYLRFSSQANNSNAIVYYDNFYLVEKEVRP
ncbi:hypothetical protein [Polaribacter staleyi]|uniref:hypothetical protein n=1 Tax=Polaribacter staleyi TaxID=2022337 RepID=UPI0031B9E7F4